MRIIGTTKRRRYAVAAVAVMLLVAACVWLLPKRGDETSGVALAFVRQPTNSPLGQLTFRLYNDGPKAIFLSWVIVETNSPGGWRVREKIEPNDPRGIQTGEFKDLQVSGPSGHARWRLRAVYGKETRGPTLLLARIEVAIEHRSTSGWHSVGVFTGSNSITSEVME